MSDLLCCISNIHFTVVNTENSIHHFKSADNFPVIPFLKMKFVFLRETYNLTVVMAKIILAAHPTPCTQNRQLKIRCFFDFRLISL